MTSSAPPDPDPFIARWRASHRRLRRARADKVAPLLDTLAALGHARPTADGRFAA